MFTSEMPRALVDLALQVWLFLVYELRKFSGVAQSVCEGKRELFFSSETGWPFFFFGGSSSARIKGCTTCSSIAAHNSHG